MRMLCTLYAIIAGHLLPRCSEERAWIGMKRFCARRAAFWMSVADWCGLMDEASRETLRLRVRYEKQALAEMGEPSP